MRGPAPISGLLKKITEIPAPNLAPSNSPCQQPGTLAHSSGLITPVMGTPDLGIASHRATFAYPNLYRRSMHGGGSGLGRLLCARALWRFKANACVRAIAEGFVAGAAAAAEPRARQAIDGSPGARADLHRAGHGKRPIGLRYDAERSSAQGQRLAYPRLGLAARHETDRLVAVIAKGFVLGSPAPAQRRAGDAAVTDELDIGMYRIGSVFADAHHIDRRRPLRWRPSRRA